jgi:hypothetical protein
MVLDRTDLDSALMFLAVVHEALSTQEKAFLAKEVEEVAKKTAAYRSKEMKKKTSTRRENTSKHCLVPSIRVEHLADLDIKRRDMYHLWQYPDYKASATPSMIARMMATCYLIDELEDETVRINCYIRLFDKLNDAFLKNKKKNAESRKKAAQGKQRRRQQKASPQQVSTSPSPKRRRDEAESMDDRPNKKKKNSSTTTPSVSTTMDNEDRRTESEPSTNSQEEEEVGEGVVTQVVDNNDM